MKFPTIVREFPLISHLVRPIYRWLTGLTSEGSELPRSAAYWEARYIAGGDSGAGSYGKFAEFKAEVLNAFVAENAIQSVIEFGCGDGNQLRLARYPRYAGFDVSPSAIRKCRATFASDATKTFDLADDYRGQVADLALSLDVIYHLVEDVVFENYMRTLFGASCRFVVVYASDEDDNSRPLGEHVRHRKFSTWVEHRRPDFKLAYHLPNRYPYDRDSRDGSFADFFIYEKSQ